MNKILTPTINPQTINCPNCGKLAKRDYIQQSQVIKTSCRSCDYLLISSYKGRVLESYAPGLKGELWTKECV
jgi:hypothetical protein